MHSTIARRPALGAVASLALAAAACGSTGAIDGATTPTLSTAPVEQTRDGLQQRVTVLPARPRTGELVAIRSTLVNRGAAPMRIEHVVCGLDYDRDTVLDNPFIMCAAYSVRTTLAPGDSIVQEDRRVVAAPPGSYTLRVRHLVPPSELSVDVPLTVVPR